MIKVDNNRIFILVQTNPSDWALNAWIDNGIDSEIVYKPVGKLLRAVRRLWVKFHFPFQQIWYNNWKEKVRTADIVIVHISSLTLDVPQYINRLNRDCRVISWYWNAVGKSIEPSLIKGRTEVWSFDPENCRQYNMRFNHQYYFNNLVLTDVKVVNDIFFCGSDSGRGKKLTDLYYTFIKAGLNVRFQIVNPTYTEIPKEIKSDYVSYERIRIEIAKSKAILEIVREGQSGATIREMEALFFGKKLITNNQHIVKEPFYNSDQFFVIDGKSTEKDIIDFMNKPMPDKDNDVIQKYEFFNWLKKFEDGKQ